MTRPISEQEKIAALAELERDSAKSKEIATRLEISEITLYGWRKAWEEGRGLDDAAPEPPPPAPPSNSGLGGRRVAYPPEVKQAVIAAYLNGEGSMAQLATRFGLTNDKIVYHWVRYAKDAPQRKSVRQKKEHEMGRTAKDGRKLPPGARTTEERAAEVAEMRKRGESTAETAERLGVHKSTINVWMNEVDGAPKERPGKRARRVFDDAFKYGVARDMAVNGLGIPQAEKRFGIGPTALRAWLRAYEDGTLKAPRGPAKKAAAQQSLPGYSQTEVVDVHNNSSNGSTLAPIPPPPSRQGLALPGQRVETKDEVISRLSSENDRLRAKVRKLLNLVADDE